MAVRYEGERGLKQLRDKLGHFTKTVDETPLRVMLEEAPRIEAEAKLETPIDTGDLRNSVRATVARNGRRVSLELSASSVHNGYDYSLIQHENTSFNHPRGGKAFYLRDPFQRGVERINARLAQEVKYDK